MLIEFSFENSRSARDRQIFSMVAGSGSELRDTNVMRPPSVPKDVSAPDLLLSSAVYGQNAGGKSNFVYAFQTFRRIVTESARSAPKDEVPVTPFAFSKQSLNNPTSFEIIFIKDGVRYQYGFSANRIRILEEWLFAFPLGKAQKWFTREFVSEKKGYEYYFGPSLTGERDLWRKSTRQNALYLSTAVQLDSKQLFSVYEWIDDKLRVVTNGGRISPTATLSAFIEGHDQEILKFLRKADFGITDLEVETEEQSVENLPASLQERIRSRESMDKGEFSVSLIRAKSLHKTLEGDTVSLELQEESDGTRKILELALPWIETLLHGYTLVIDELHQSLHTHLLKYLIEMFHDEELNKNGAQLIFTTHNTSILSSEIFRRDQIWFIERQGDQASSLFPLSDFRMRKNSNIEAAYLAGRFGAVPFTKRFLRKDLITDE